MMSVATTHVERAAPARDYEDYYDEEGYGDYGTEEAVAGDAVEEAATDATADYDDWE